MRPTINLRTRAEFHWAIFLVLSEIEFNYEMEGFVLSSGESYRPSFWLPKQKCWLDIQAVDRTHEEHIKDLHEVAEATSTWGLVAAGLPSQMSLSYVGHDSTDSGGGRYPGRLNARIVNGGDNFEVYVDDAKNRMFHSLSGIRIPISNDEKNTTQRLWVFARQASEMLELVRSERAC